MASDRISRQRFVSAVRRAGPEAASDGVAAHYLAPTLATDLSPLCSAALLHALTERITMLERRDTRLAAVPFDADVIRRANTLYERANSIGGVTGLALGSVAVGLITPPYGFFIGLFMPGVILCFALAAAFQSLALSRSRLLQGRVPLNVEVRLGEAAG